MVSFATIQRDVKIKRKMEMKMGREMEMAWVMKMGREMEMAWVMKMGREMEMYRGEGDEDREIKECTVE
jgi:hypothetical protein